VKGFTNDLSPVSAKACLWRQPCCLGKKPS
jgi:hypothetical protein